jgi:hypothetical protein
VKTHTHDSYTTSPVRMRVLTLADFGETLLAIKQGLRMRRSSWPDTTAYIALRGADDAAPYIYTASRRFGRPDPWLPSQSGPAGAVTGARCERAIA